MSHLILHKVRGEPAFDIAEQMEVDGEMWWIIPTSGHRAYPYKHWPLSYFMQTDPYVPDDWPDHYNVSKEHSGPKIGLGEIMAMVMPKLRRRI